MFDRIFPVDDNTLAEKAKTSQHDFARLYDRFADVVFRFVRRRVNNVEDAQDIVSETFMAVATSLKNFDQSKGNFKTRLLQIAYYKFSNHLRGVYEVLEEDLDENSQYSYEDDVVTKITNKQCYEEILSFATMLPERQSSLFFLKYVEELSNKEIAEVCKLSQKTVSSTLSFIHQKIEKHLV